MLYVLMSTCAHISIPLVGTPIDFEYEHPHDSSEPVRFLSFSMHRASSWLVAKREAGSDASSEMSGISTRKIFYFGPGAHTSGMQGYVAGLQDIQGLSSAILTGAVYIEGGSQEAAATADGTQMVRLLPEFSSNVPTAAEETRHAARAKAETDAQAEADKARKAERAAQESAAAAAAAKKKAAEGAAATTAKNAAKEAAKKKAEEDTAAKAAKKAAKKKADDDAAAAAKRKAEEDAAAKAAKKAAKKASLKKAGSTTGSPKKKASTKKAGSTTGSPKKKASAKKAGSTTGSPKKKASTKKANE